jgi:hypothetical protein
MCKTPQEIAEYKQRWKMRGEYFSVPIHSDGDWRGKSWCRKNLQRQQWSFSTYTGVYEHTFYFENESDALKFKRFMYGEL